MATNGLDVLARAVAFAAEYHNGTVRKSTEIPYIVHPMEAAVIVSTMTNDLNVIAAAILHDVLEDTGATAETIAKEFNQVICDLVMEESEDKREGIPAAETWKIRKQETIEKLSRSSLEAKMVALGDKLSNIRAINRDLNQIGEELWNRFNQRDPAMQGWYYRTVLSALEELSEYEAYQEYKVLVSEVFEKY